MSARKPAAAKIATAKAVTRPKPSRLAAAEPAVAKPVGTADGDLSAVAKQLATDIERALAQGQIDPLSPEAVQALLAAACRSYAAQVEAGNGLPALAERSRVTSTDVMVTASGLLKSANLAVFELGMWQSWTGR